MPAAHQRIYEIAEDDMGFLTTASAAEVGVSSMALVMMANRGVLERVSRGVYRLVRFPVHPLAQLRQGTLWPYPVEGVVSHESALVLHNLSDASPRAVHVTVPARYRLRRALPAWLRLHRAEISGAERMRAEGIPVTAIPRTIRDCIAAHLGPALVSQAIDQARERGSIDVRTAHGLEAELHGSGHTR